jgi:hypothetical protein
VSDWLREEVSKGIAALYLLRLPGAPAGDLLAETVGLWVAVIRNGRAFTAAQDVPRFRRAFLALASAERWPTPKQLLDALPPPPAPKLLSKPKPNPEVGRRAIAELAAFLGVPAKTEPKPEQSEPSTSEAMQTRAELLARTERELHAHFDAKKAAAGDRDRDED